MRSMRVMVLGLGMSVAAVPALAAPNDVKPGLWEWTSDSESTRDPPLFSPQALAKLTPEKRAYFRRELGHHD